MSKLTSREICLASRPNGLPTAANFTLAWTASEPLKDQEVLVRNLFMSVDPYMRGRMNEGRSYVPAFEIGKPLEGAAVGDVIESRAPEFQAGDVVTSNFGWREYFTASPKALHRVGRDIQPLSAYLGVLGMTGLTAWTGLNLVEVKAGNVIFISGAAGAVGNVAGQLAKLRGCRVIGSAGSAEKVPVLRDECVFDGAFNYKAGPVAEQLKREAPEGIDVYFDNVGGETLQAALSALRVHGRIIACGSISGYNVDGGEKWGHFGGCKGASGAVTLWPPAGAEIWESDRGLLLGRIILGTGLRCSIGFAFDLQNDRSLDQPIQESHR